MPARHAVVPEPVRLEAGSGVLRLGPGFGIRADADLRPAAERAAALLGGDLGCGTGVVLELRHDPALRHPEGYRLSVTPERARIAASSVRGAHWAVQTAAQLLDGERLPCVEIEDEPRFGYRGAHLDVARHFLPVAFVERFVDLLARFKLNTFHWHLTDDQGWRLPIEAYPRLCEVGAFRPETLVGHSAGTPRRFDGTPHGGFYSKDEVARVVAHAAARGVEVIPEIEMPGHASAVLAAYPELGCTGGPYRVATSWGVFDDVLCAGSPAVAEFVERVLAEVAELFGGHYVHCGGDEAPRTRWRECASCQAAIRQHGLAGESALHGWFVRRAEEILERHGRRLIGWDDILEGGLSPHATVMSWRGTAGGAAAAELGHDVIMAPASHCYLDQYQARRGEPLAIGGYLPLRKVHAFDPLQGLHGAAAERVLGGQACLWTEYVPSPRHAEYMAFPRLCAMAEALWSKQRSWRRFRRRLPAALRVLDGLGVAYRH